MKLHGTDDHVDKGIGMLLALGYTDVPALIDM